MPVDNFQLAFLSHAFITSPQPPFFGFLSQGYNQIMKIGVLKYRFEYYTYLRNILHKLPEAEYVPLEDLFSYRRRFALAINRRSTKALFDTFDLNNQFEDYDLNKVDLIHLFNGISYGHRPWVTGFETIVPRFSELMQRYHGKTKAPMKMTAKLQRGFEALKSPFCKKIIAMSQSAALMQTDLLMELPYEDQEIIRKKMIVIHPPQEVLVDQPIQREYDARNPIRLIMVGDGFFRKGGREILRAFDKLIHEENANLKLILVSSLTMDHYAAKETQEDLVWASNFIQEHSDWIEHHTSLSPAEVLTLMKTCDIGLLPTYADSYGFSVLEAQACGLPVISTDIRALPEINNTDCGWLIRVPKNEMSEALYSTPEERAHLSQQIQDGLEAILRNILKDPSSIHPKALKALQRIREMHDPEDFSQKLREIYQKALE